MEIIRSLAQAAVVLGLIVLGLAIVRISHALVGINRSLEEIARTMRTGTPS
ncbi:MAG: hypothetical protein ABFD89_17235 [Bryobacteraceae bacterium]